MPNLLEQIARENFRSSGYLSQPSRERSSSWIYSSPPRSPFTTNNTVQNIMQRRERALHRQTTKPSFFQTCLNAFLHR